MQFFISTTLLSLTLATFGLAAPSGSLPGADIEQRAPNPDAKSYDWNKDWDGKVTPIEEIGEDVTERGISKRNPGLIYICPAYDWQPANGVGCSRLQWARPDQCVRLNEKYYRYTLSAVGPDPGTWCRLFTSTNCRDGGSPMFTYPGMGRLDGWWSEWNDNTGSILCWW